MSSATAISSVLYPQNNLTVNTLFNEVLTIPIPRDTTKILVMIETLEGLYEFKMVPNSNSSQFTQWNKNLRPSGGHTKRSKEIIREPTVELPFDSNTQKEPPQSSPSSDKGYEEEAGTLHHPSPPVIVGKSDLTGLPGPLKPRATKPKTPPPVPERKTPPRTNPKYRMKRPTDLSLYIPPPPSGQEEHNYEQMADAKLEPDEETAFDYTDTIIHKNGVHESFL